MTENLTLRDFLAENYSTHPEVKELWKRVGGNTGRILDQTDSRSRWTALIQQMESGALPRFKLLTEVLKDYPGSTIILNELAKEMTTDVLMPAKQLVQQVSSTAFSEPLDIDFTVFEKLKPDEMAPAIAVEVFRATPEERKRFKINLEVLKEKALTAVLSAAATAAVAEMVKGLHLALAGN